MKLTQCINNHAATKKTMLYVRPEEKLEHTKKKNIKETWKGIEIKKKGG